MAQQSCSVLDFDRDGVIADGDARTCFDCFGQIDAVGDCAICDLSNDGVVGRPDILVVSSCIGVTCPLPEALPALGTTAAMVGLLLLVATGRCAPVRGRRD
ncbi:MAG: hypothetical protein IH884_14435 [Myxococcales bacterium]|nr:hypothetical protein [Myxococcales bacterium]